MQVLLAACHEPAYDQNTPPKVPYVFEHKTKYILIYAPYTRTVVFCYISNIPQWFFLELNLLSYPHVYIAAIYVEYCYTNGRWLFWLIS